MAQSSPEAPEMSDPVSKSELIKIIECPVCMEVPYPPIYQCAKGHSICKFCKPKLNRCPICKSCLSSACRNFMVEEIVRASKHFCPYKKDGCTVEKTGELMEAHINNCQYGPFMCPRNGLESCKAKLKFPEASSHLFFQHMATIAPGPSQLISRTVQYNCFDVNGKLKSDLNWPPNQILFDGKHFLAEVYTLKDRIFWAVLCIGSESDAKKYNVKIVCQPGQEREIQWIIPVDPISTGVQLRDPLKIENRFLPSCSMTDLRLLAENFQQASLYRFFTKYEIIPSDKTLVLKTAIEPSKKLFVI